MIGGLAFRAGEDHPDMRLYLVPVSRAEDGRYLVLRRAARRPARSPALPTMCLCPSIAACRFRRCATASSPGSKVNPNPIYRTPFIAVHYYALFAPALGVARGGYVDFVQWTRRAVSDLHAARHRPARAGADLKVAEIAAQIDAAELLARRTLAPARTDYSGMTMETRTLLRRDFTYAMRMLRDAMD